jgi:hypothetical protein
LELLGFLAFSDYKCKKYFNGLTQLLEESKKQKIINDNQINKYKKLLYKIKKDNKEKELKEVMNSKTNPEAKSHINKFFNYLNKSTSLSEVYGAIKTLRNTFETLKYLTV